MYSPLILLSIPGLGRTRVGLKPRIQYKAKRVGGSLGRTRVGLKQD